jgi:crotonobetainyl-CoA:carnitine CoA-transferase CaiB-like acyl-CoA transferase
MPQSNSVLDGLRVVEVATFVFGPAAATVLSDFGADVIKIEHPVGGDPYRMLKDLPPLPRCEQNYCWLLDGRNKRSVAANLKTDAGREVVLELARGADVFVTNYHPSVLADLRLRHEDLAADNERLIYAHATGYGELGDEVERPGYDATAWWARSGLMDAVRAGDATPGIATPGMGDHPSAMALLSGILLALYARERSGRGTKVSTSLLANGLWSNSIFLQAALCGAEPYVPATHAKPANALVNYYATRDGRYFYLALVMEVKDWERFCRAIERPELIRDPRFAERDVRRKNAEALTSILDQVFAERELAAWRRIFDEQEITYGPISRVDELPDDPQVRANGLLPEIEDPRIGRLRTVDSPVRLEGVEKRRPSLAPEIGEHTREVLASLGYADERIRQLEAAGAVRCFAPDRR